MPRRTKILATLGPASEAPEVLDAMLAAGLDLVRINLSHGDRTSQQKLVRRARDAAERAGRPLGILLDLQGPKIRIERFRTSRVTLEDGQSFVLDAAWPEDAGNQERVGVGYKELPNDVKPGDTLALADGLILLSVDSVAGTRVEATVKVGGVLSDNKGINLVGGGLSVGALTKKDKEDIRFAANLDVDYLAVSFVNSAEDVKEARRLLQQAGGQARIVAKIERKEALDKLPEIMREADAVMIARGDLAVEIGDAKLAGVQKDLMRAALLHDCVVITATQMMQSMVESPRPTRAEVLDVGNAVLDGTDAVMLSEETAVGDYPAEAVAAMAEVCEGTERHPGPDPAFKGVAGPYKFVDEAIAKAAMETANRLGVTAIAALTESGSTVRWMSRVSTNVPVYAFTPNERTCRAVTLYRGVYPVMFQAQSDNPLEVSGAMMLRLKEMGEAKTGDLVITTKGDLQGVEGGTNSLRIVAVE